jgi:hypothetical protein
VAADRVYYKATAVDGLSFQGDPYAPFEAVIPAASLAVVEKR